MIILTGGQKGGTGKSTIATNLSAWLKRSGQDVLLVDCNVRQGTSRNWAARREENGYPVVPCVEASGNVYKTLVDLANRYEQIVVDAGGQDSPEFRSALVASQLLISPIRPTQADIETLLYVGELVEQAKAMNSTLQSWLILSQAPPSPNIKLVDEARELLTNLDQFRLIDVVIYSRKVYMDALTLGAGVMELDNPKACQEIESLAAEIYGRPAGKRKGRSR